MNISIDPYIIIPVYNDSASVTNVATALLKAGYGKIIIIDDGSSDDVMEKLKHLPVFYLKHSVNLGQGAALQTGINYAIKQEAEIIITFDADGQHQPADIAALLEPIVADEADIVLGSRFLSDDLATLPTFRKLTLQTARFINLLFSGLLLSDAHNGLRALNKKAMTMINLTENKMAHASEILFEIKKYRLRWKEVPVNISYTPQTIKKGQSSVDSIRILFDLVLHKLFK